MVTIEQLNQLINEGNDLANAIHNFLLSNLPMLSKDDQNELVNAENKVRSIVANLTQKRDQLLAQQQKAQQTVEYEFRFIQNDPNVKWATKGYYIAGPKGGLLAPITPTMAYLSSIGLYMKYPDYVINFYKQNYPDLFRM
jgi:hypothetical protein